MSKSSTQRDHRDVCVERVEAEGEGVLSLTLVDAGGAALPDWEPGAHIDVVLPSGLVRQYSLCGPERVSPSGYRIAVLHEPAGRGGSREIHRDVVAGTALAISEPRDRFPLVDAPAYLFLAGGIGITPLLAMAREVAARGRPWRFVYGARSRSAMSFVRELELLQGGDVHLVPEDECGLPSFADEVAHALPGAEVYACGPEGMLDHLVELRSRDRWSQQLHLERFTGAEEPVARDGTFEVELARSGQGVIVHDGQSILDAVREVVPTVAFSCEDGYCGTCETVVLSGVPEHRDSYLDDGERQAGETMMICVSRSAGPSLRLDL